MSEYADSSKALIARMKFGGARAAADSMSAMMSPFLEDDAVLVPVPTATSRVRARGFDQAKLLSVRLAHRCSAEEVGALRRIGQSRQVGATRQQRLLQLRDSFEVSSDTAISGRHVVLVDDVMTTGATLEAAASALKRAGAKRVDAIVFAHG